MPIDKYRDYTLGIGDTVIHIHAPDGKPVAVIDRNRFDSLEAATAHCREWIDRRIDDRPSFKINRLPGD